MHEIILHRTLKRVYQIKFLYTEQKTIHPQYSYNDQEIEVQFLVLLSIDQHKKNEQKQGQSNNEREKG
jgi:hypothetical protein